MLLLSGCDDKEETVHPRIDLAVESFTFTIDKTSQFEGNIHFKAIIKNVGDDFRSNAGQQSILVSEMPPGGQARTLVTKPFKDLDAGETIELEFIQQGWRASHEFPSTFVVRLNFDPDLYIDGNPLNDDSDPSNNSKEITGQQINDQF